ncbi:TetR/AcrR family transcriptional regulator [Actinomycetospora atypica]|uniref:TetR/AcrR family transcriptional regulator n=1 Tax=Actinomycetospora atypica TaxID=1290095 RepID=A0ABV9YQ20_9PSEU
MTSSARDRLLEAAVAHFAENGLRDQSLRAIATAIGSSHRMLIYHFGSREGLLADVVGVCEAQQRELLGEVASAIAAGDDPHTLLMAFWHRVLDAGLRFGPLFFELSVHAMRDEPHARSFRVSLVEPWLEVLTPLLARLGDDGPEAAARGRLGLAVTRGLIHDALVTGDTEAATAAMEDFLDVVVARPGGEPLPP